MFRHDYHHSRLSDRHHTVVVQQRLITSVLARLRFWLLVDHSSPCPEPLVPEPPYANDGVNRHVSVVYGVNAGHI